MNTVRRQTIGFGCPAVGSPHHMVVNIPEHRNDAVLVVEHFGIQATRDGELESVERVELSRTAWSAIADTLRKTFNERLKEKSIAGSKWAVGENKLDRLLGKELCVLAWAIEKVPDELIPAAITNWLGLKPEERWWLFTVTAAATGGIDDGDIGWRKALRYALTENPVNIELKPKRRRGRSASSSLSLFPLLEKKL